MAQQGQSEPLHETEIVQLAEELEQKGQEEAIRSLAQLPPETAAEVLRHMDHETSSELLAHLKRPEAADILDEMVPDSAADLIEELTEAARDQLLRDMRPEEAEVLRDLIAYPPDTAGGLMSPEVIALPEDLTIQQAIEWLRREASEAETVYYAYVVDHERRLLGVLSMRDLIMTGPDRPIRDLMYRDVLTVEAEADAEDVARLFDRYNFLALPVLDRRDRLLGIVTVDDVIDAIRKEETEDMHRLVGVDPQERVLSPWYQSLRRRQPWLLVNLVTAFAAAAVVGLFQGTIAKFTALAVLMPVIAGQGGNAGSQTVTVVVRGMALGEVEPGKGWRVIAKEVLLGAVNGVVIGAIVAIGALLWQGNPMLGLVVALAMFFTLIMAGVTGALIPLGLRFAGTDPALASTILLTTVTDIGGFLFLLGLASLLLV